MTNRDRSSVEDVIYSERLKKLDFISVNDSTYKLSTRWVPWFDIVVILSRSRKIINRKIIFY